VISRRIIVNLGVFVGVFLLLAYWAVSNVVSIDRIDRPYRVTAYFSTSPGLRDGFEVAYLGLRVGTIGTVELIDDPTYCVPAGEAGGEEQAEGDESGQASTGACVAVELKIDRGTVLPANLTPFVRRKSAVGEPYVDLVVVPGEDTGQLEAGAHLTDGRIPLAYSDLFAALNSLVQAVPEDSLTTVFHELALGLDGRADDIRRIVESAEDLTGTLAADPALLTDLTNQLTTLTHTLAEHRVSVGTAVDNLAALAESLAANRVVLAEFLDTAPEFAGQLSALLDAVDGDLTCALRSLSIVVTDLSQPATLAQVDRLLDVALEAGSVIGSSLRQLPDGTWITGGFQFNAANGSPVPVYAEPGVLPAPPPLVSCSLALPGGAGAGGPSAPAPGGSASPGGDDTPATATERPPAEPDELDESTDRPSEKSDLLRDLLPYVGALALLAVLLAVLRPWRWFGAGPARGTEDSAVAAAERSPAGDHMDADELAADDEAHPTPDDDDTLRS
jgi:phospholipid/cholesterol/gamma-HCH transport system substrate-binding protein